MQLSADERAAFERAAANPVARLERRCREWFDEQRTFWTCTDLLAAAQCGRRAGKTSGGCPAMLLDAMTTPGFRGLYINETRAECARLAWHGGSGDGMYSLVVSLGLPFVDNQTELTLRYIRDPLRPDLDSWIYLIGVDDEGHAVGLAEDLKFMKSPDLDRYELWLRDHLTKTLGTTATASVEVEFPELSGQQVCHVRITPSPRPVFLTPGKNQPPQLWVRVGNSTRQLDVAEALIYAADRWGRRRLR